MKSNPLKGTDIMQKTRTSRLATMAIAAVCLTVANTAFASSYVHSSNSERGYVLYPEHFKSDRTRAQVQAEAAEFVKRGGTDSFRSQNYPALDAIQQSNKTREQVVNEWMNESPEQRKARLEWMRG